MLVVTIKLTIRHFTQQPAISVFQFKMISFEKAKIILPFCIDANMYRVEKWSWQKYEIMIFLHIFLDSRVSTWQIYSDLLSRKNKPLIRKCFAFYIILLTLKCRIVYKLFWTQKKILMLIFYLRHCTIWFLCPNFGTSYMFEP